MTRRSVPRPRPRVGALASVVVAVLGLLLAGACGEDAEEPTSRPEDCTPIEDGAVTLVAQNLAWDTDCLEVAQGTEITFTVDNRDRGVQHDLEVDGPSGKASTELEAGPVVQTLAYDASEPGRHPFVCTIHPDMAGDLWVVPDGEG